MTMRYRIAFFNIKAQIIHSAAVSLSAIGVYEIHKPTYISYKKKPGTLSLPSAQP
jgi:hypothetical protein